MANLTGTNFNLEKSIKRIENKINNINPLAEKTETKSPQRETWVKLGVIKKLTGWDWKDMIKARASNLVKMKRTEEGIFYLLESLHPAYIIAPGGFKI